MKSVISLLFLFLSIVNIWSQDLDVTEINQYTNPEHRDNIGTWARGETFNVKGTYTSTTAKIVRLRLLTFAKGTWTNPLAVHNVDVATSAPYSGVIDHSLTIPNDYVLGDDTNTQMLQVSVSFNGFDTKNYNYFLTVSDAVSSKVLDFDALYSSASGSTLVNNINDALSNANVGDTILFKSPEYNFDGKSFNIEKAVCLSGVVPTKNETIVGAYNVTSSFKNLKQLNIRSNNVSLSNLKLQAHTSTTYVFTRVAHTTYGDDSQGVHYTGIKMNNVILDGGKVQVFGGNGAEIEFHQVSFINFSQGGYFLNRKGRVNNAPKFLIEKSFFKPDFSQVNYNVRAISLDAGNDEYPVVWNQNGSTINNCKLDGTGLGISSKCAYVNVTNSHFLGYRKDVDMIHIEEFGHHFLIDGNTFEHISPARGLYIDREIQQAHHITITNNKWIGTYAWVISSNSPYNLVFENNDFTQASASNANDITFDFTYDHGNETQFLEYELPAKNVIFRNNPGLSTKDGVLSYRELSGETSNEIEYPSSKIHKKILNVDAKSIINTDETYRIKNKLNGEYLIPADSNDRVGFSSTKKDDESDVWVLEFKYPYYHAIKNIKTGKYIEVYRGYTLGDINNGTSERIFAEQKYTFNQLDTLPFWYFRKHMVSGETVYEMMPGGNERKSRALKVDNYLELEIAQENGQPKVNDDANLWVLEPAGPGLSISDEQVINDFSVYADATRKQIVIQIYNQNIQKKKISIVNMNGQIIHSQNFMGSKIDYSINTSKISTGVYVVALDLDGKINRKRVIIH